MCKAGLLLYNLREADLRFNSQNSHCACVVNSEFIDKQASRGISRAGKFIWP